MQITSYGLFWRSDDVDWFPGQGKRKEFRLLGRIGQNRPGIRMADFRFQQGIYILYDQYGPAYVGLAAGERLGQRLKDHLEDQHAQKWDRFSWFGFNQVKAEPDADGVHGLLAPRSDVTDDTTTTIRDLEALLIRAMGPKLNVNRMSFVNAEEWVQVSWWEWVETYRARIGS